MKLHTTKKLNIQRSSLVEPAPRKAKPINCLLIASYAAFFFLLLSTWFNLSTRVALIQTYTLFLLSFVVIFLILIKRQNIFNFYCRLVKRKIILFEVGFAGTIFVLYMTIATIAPIMLGMIPHDVNSHVLNNDKLTRFILFSSASVLCVSVISGFDIYPVNNYNTVKSVERLIDITKGFLKAFNRVIITIAGAILVGNIFSNRVFELNEIYITVYGIIGGVVGISGVLGMRIADLLHKLTILEQYEDEEDDDE